MSKKLFAGFLVSLILCSCSGGGGDSGGGGSGGGASSSGANSSISGSTNSSSTIVSSSSFSSQTSSVFAIKPAAPVVTHVGNITIKTVSLEWPRVPDATEYKITQSIDESENYVLKETTSLNAVKLREPLWLITKSKYVVSACNTAGCTDSSPISINLDVLKKSIGTTYPSFGDQNQRFGRNVALSKDASTMAVAARGSDGGSVSVYTFDNGVWSIQQVLRAPFGDVSDDFGGAISISADGNSIVVGAAGESSSATGIDGDQKNNDSVMSGAAYVFTRTNGTWAMSSFIKADRNSTRLYFGQSVSISSDGNTLAIGAPGESTSGTGVNSSIDQTRSTSSGAVYLFKKGLTSWVQTDFIKPLVNVSGAMFGQAVAISGNGLTLAVGSFSESSSATGLNGDGTKLDSFESGAVWVFDKGTFWAQTAYIKPANNYKGEHFGAALSISMDGSTLVIGAPNESSNATGVNGNQSNILATNSGAVFVYSNKTGLWGQSAYLKSIKQCWNCLFGTSVSVSADGGLIGVGMPKDVNFGVGFTASSFSGDSIDAGSASTFKLVNNEWIFASYLKAPTVILFQVFGTSVAMSADGKYLVVGAVTDSTKGLNTGAVYTF